MTELEFPLLVGETVRFPFLGSRSDGEPFQYVLLEVENEKVQIAIFNWLVQRDKLSIDEVVNIYIPCMLTAEYDLRGSNEGVVTSMRHEPLIAGDIYEITFPKQILPATTGQLSYSHFIDEVVSTLPLPELICKLIKDSIFLKHGIRIYLKHLIPYFERVVDYSPKEYLKFKELFLLDVAKQVLDHENRLRETYELLETKVKKIENIPEFLDLEFLREIMASEIYLTSFNIALNKTSTVEELEQIIRKNSSGNVNYNHTIYLAAIKELEKRLYSNYNHIVIAYVKSL